jgi:hypothetical protein
VHQRYTPKLFGLRHTCDGAARAPRARGHLLPVPRVTADRRVDSASLLHDSPDERNVLLLDFAIVELPREFAMSRVVLGGHHHTGRSAIKPMHDAWPQLAADAAQILDVVQQRVH